MVGLVIMHEAAYHDIGSDRTRYAFVSWETVCQVRIFGRLPLELFEKTIIV